MSVPNFWAQMNYIPPKVAFCPQNPVYPSEPGIQEPLQPDPHFISPSKFLSPGGKVRVSSSSYEAGRYCIALCGSKEAGSYVAGPPGAQDMLKDSALWKTGKCGIASPLEVEAGVSLRHRAVPAAPLAGHLIPGQQGSLATAQLPACLLSAARVLTATPRPAAQSLVLHFIFPEKPPQLAQHVASVSVSTELWGQDNSEVTSCMLMGCPCGTSFHL